MSEHTPGPWKHHRPTGAVKDDDLKLVASVYGDDPECNEDSRQIANARLIAAAPDLLAAAKRALAVFKAQGESIRGGTVLVALDDAIAKATGAA